MSRIAKLLQLRGPVLQAPMAGVQGAVLAAAVSNAGGLGSIPGAMHSAESLATEIALFRQLSNGPVNVNFFAHRHPLITCNSLVLEKWNAVLLPYFAELGLDLNSIPRGAGRAPFSDAFAEVMLNAKPEVVSFHFGLPSVSLMEKVKSSGAQVWSTATTADEALWLQDHGADAIIAQGSEAGGHRGMFLTDDLATQKPMRELLSTILPLVTVPVIAAGGIFNEDSAVQVLAQGADAVQLGSIYLFCPEATVSAVHRAALQSDSRATQTKITNVFTGRPARGIVNRLMTELGPISHIVPPFPLAAAAIFPLRAAAEARGSDDFTSLWAGSNAYLSKHQLTAQALTSSFIESISSPSLSSSLPPRSDCLKV